VTHPADVVVAALRWLEYMGLIGWVGVVVVRRLAVIGPELRWARPPMQQALAAALAGGLGLVVAELVLGRTSAPAIVRVIAEAAALGMCLAGRRWLWVPAFLAVLLLAVGGHAAEVQPPVGPVFVDTVHVLSAGMWAGGILVLATLRPPGGWAGEEGRELLGRFGRVALLAFAVTALTGVLRAVESLGDVSGLWTTTYGEVLDAKALVVLVMLGLSAAALRRGPPFLRAEAAVAAAVLGATAILAAIPLPSGPGH
jgi:putative copper export protein